MGNLCNTPTIVEPNFRLNAKEMLVGKWYDGDGNLYFIENNENSKGFTVKNEDKIVVYNMTITASTSKVRLEGEGGLDKFKARINSRLLEWYHDQDERIFWSSDPLPPSDQEHLVEVKHEFENLDEYDIGFIERDKLKKQKKDKCSFAKWEYRPGGKKLTKREKKKAAQLLEEYFDTLSGNQEYMNFEEFCEWFDVFLKEIEDMRISKADKKLKKSGEKTVYSGLDPEVEKHHVSVIFHHFDKDEDTFLDYKEMTQLVQQTNPEALDWGKISYKRLCRQYGVDGTFGFSEEDLLRVYSDQLENLERDFAQFSMGEVYDPPVKYKVTVYKKNLKVREGYRLDSQEVGILQPGEVVVADQRKDRRIRIIFPIKGWVSWQNKQGYIVMKQEN